MIYTSKVTAIMVVILCAAHIQAYNQITDAIWDNTSPVPVNSVEINNQDAPRSRQDVGNITPLQAVFYDIMT